MHSSKTILIIFLATIVTFLVALGALVVLNRPELLDRFDPRQRTEDARDHEARTTRRSTDTVNAGGCRVTGRVLDLKGKPVQKAFVHALEELVRAGQEVELLATVESDADGFFQLVLDEPRDSIRLVICAKGLPRWQKHHLGLTADEAGTDLGDVALQVGGTLKVYVRDEEGRSVYGASVEVVDPWEVPQSLRRQPLTARTEADGVAVVQGTDFGHYQVTVSKEGYSTSHQTMSFDRANPMDGFAMDAVIFHATSWIKGTVQDTRGGPVLVGGVVARPTRSDLTEQFAADLAEDGSFQIGPLPKGEYQISVESPGMIQRSTVLSTADGAPVRLVVDYSGKVTGTITLPDGFTQGPIQLGLSRRGPDGRMVPFQGAHQAQVDPDSLLFKIEGLPGGTYQVRATTAGLAPGRSQAFHLEPGQQEEAVSIELSMGGSLDGAIVDARGAGTGNAVIRVFEGETVPSSALLSLYTGSTQAQADPAADGTFQLRRLSPGMHMVLVESPGLPSRTFGPLLIQDRGEVHLGKIVLGAGASIVGTRLDAEGRPAAGLLRVQEQTSGLFLLLATDQDAHFGLRGLSPGTYTVHAVVGPNEAGGTPAPLTLKAGEQVRHDPRER